MELLPMNKLGPHVDEIARAVDFGLFLPWVSAQAGNRLWVRVIHEHDQFLQDIQPLDFELQHSVDPKYGDYWSGHVDIANTPKPHPSSQWGTPGRYVYRFMLRNPNVSDPIDWIIDPYAREFGVGKFSAFTLGYQPYDWEGNAAETGWKVPDVHDLVVYELMLTEFAGSLEGAMERLDYLKDLGVNCLELMPMSNVEDTVDWGFLPLGYFGVDERFGKRRDFQRLVHEAHKRGIAVMVDAVYGHTGDQFPYSYVYRQLGYQQNPFLGDFAKNMFGESTDYTRQFTRDYFFTVNHFWLNTFHVDGFRYDCVPNYWDGPLGVGYANLTYHTYQAVKNQGASGHWQRFFAGNGPNLIQCAEQLEDPQGVLTQSYSNCTWQNRTLDAAKNVAHGNTGALEHLGLDLGLAGYIDSAANNGDQIAKSALQYIENHDHSRFICNFGLVQQNSGEGASLFGEGDLNRWYKLQPYLIGLFTAKGVPFLWQGQEFGENYYLPTDGIARVRLQRSVRWGKFYTTAGKRLIALTRRLAALRRQSPQFRNGGHYFYNHYDRYQSKNMLVFSRHDGQKFSMIALNFGDGDQAVPIPFPHAGNYTEELHGTDNQNGVAANTERWLHVPSNYGRIWTTGLS